MIDKFLREVGVELPEDQPAQGPSQNKRPKKSRCHLCPRLKDKSECKKTWANLRESKRRAVVKKRTKNGQAATSSKNGNLKKRCLLLPHMKQIKTISSLTEDDSEVDDNFYVDELLSNHDDSPMTSNDPELNITNRPESSSTNTSANSPLFPNISKRKRFKETRECTSASAQLLQYLLKEKETNKDDEIDKFFSSIATTVKKLNRYSQSVLKSRIFNMVSEFELQEIQEQTHFYAGSSRHNTDIEIPSGYNTYNTGPSGCNTYNIGSLDYNIHNAGPSGYNSRNEQLSGNNPPVLEEPIFNSELANATQKNDSLD
ncbi:unnamed protein product [Parnassius apollo]|uniref:(apollo) hypothetical protein n=1 Tax=Parnassius apollo TaxID=110799 RepID=A0A8S3X3X0_PARAO|nr:unnamed protein product [Parnassius apollo]